MTGIRQRQNLPLPQGLKADRQGLSTSESKYPEPRGRNISAIPKPLPALPSQGGSLTGVRPRGRPDNDSSSARRGFRPESKAEAFLVLVDERSDKTASIQLSEIMSRTRGSLGGLSRGAIPTVGSPQNALAGDKRRTFDGPPKIPERSGLEKKYADAPKAARSFRAGKYSQRDGPDAARPRSDEYSARSMRNESNRSQIPSRVRPKSKVLPALPQDKSSLPSTAHGGHQRAEDAFRVHQAKVLRGQRSPNLKPAPKLPSSSSRSSASTRYSCDSDQQTRGKGASEKSIEDDAANRPRLVFRRGEEKKDTKVAGGWSTILSRKPSFPRKRKASPPDVDDSPDRDRPWLQRSIESLRERSALRTSTTSRALSRCPSTASAYSVVIQPTRSHSPVPEVPRMPPTLHVTEEDMPLRIRHILGTRGDVGISLSNAASATTSPREESYHADLILSIETLRDSGDGELEDIVFDIEDV